MTVQDGFFFGVGLWGSFLVFLIFLLVVTLLAAFVSYLTDKGKRENVLRQSGRRDGDDDRQG